MGIFIKNEEQINRMRAASRIVAKTHEILEKYIKPGVTTGELNKIADDYIKTNGGHPSFFGYKGFPASTCISVNNEVIHGIPGMRKLKSGDIISIDIGVFINRFHSDAARTHPVGDISPRHMQLIKITKESFFNAIQYARHGCRLHEISAAVEDYANTHGFTVVQDWCGHGIGSQMHEDPQVPNHHMPKRGPRLERGMTLAVEPMVNEGKEDVEVLENNWTIVTKDGKYSAHYENTILITDSDPEIMTL
jgi:methionyl aminopeptidase